jgi:hypothetical protein
MVPWPDTDTRNDFILKLTGQDVRYSDGV